MTDSLTFDRLAAMVVLLTKGAIVGRASLNRLLWFADVAHLIKFGSTISGARYARRESGPRPAEIETVVRVLKKRHLLEEHIEESTLYLRYAYQAKAKNIDFGVLKQAFRKSERGILKAVKHSLRGLGGPYLMEQSRSSDAWIAAGSGEDLEFSRALSDVTLHVWLREQGVI